MTKMENRLWLATSGIFKIPSLGSFPSPWTVYPDFDSCYSHFMPYRMTPSVRHRAIEVHYYYYYYYTSRHPFWAISCPRFIVCITLLRIQLTHGVLKKTFNNNNNNNNNFFLPSHFLPCHLHLSQISSLSPRRLTAQQVGFNKSVVGPNILWPLVLAASAYTKGAKLFFLWPKLIFWPEGAMAHLLSPKWATGGSANCSNTHNSQYHLMAPHESCS